MDRRAVPIALHYRSETVGDMSRVTVNFDLSKIPSVRF